MRTALERHRGRIEKFIGDAVMADEVGRERPGDLAAAELQDARLVDRGFIVSMLLIPYRNSAVRMLEDGLATREDIDTVIHLGLNHPMGPIRLIDVIGLTPTCSSRTCSSRSSRSRRSRPRRS